MRYVFFRPRPLAIAFCAALLLNPAYSLAEIDCTDGIDNDGDLLVDCLDDSCDAQTCNDGVICTLGETCVFATASCTVGTPTDSVCDNLLFCDGLETCDPALDCQAGTPPVTDDGIACTDDFCDEAADIIVNAPNDALCDNGLFCDGIEACDILLDCQAGTPPCDDGVACTDENCDDVLDVCGTSVPNDANCDDGLFCNGTETCDAALDCQSGISPCDDGVACTDENCDDVLDVCGASVPNNADCDNGVFCDGTETCDALLDCQAGSDPCDDGVACTDDSCDDVLDSCAGNVPNDANCDDGLFCTGAESCDALLDCQPGLPPSCDDGVGCTVDTCNQFADACINLPNNGLCSNGAPCDGVELCNPISGCEAGTPVDCSGLASDCASASCNVTTGACEITPIAGTCDDGDPCTPNDVCVGGVCSPGGTLCGDGLIQPQCGEDCDPPSTQVCDSLVDGDGDGLVGCLDSDCCDALTPTCASDCTAASFCKPILDDPAVIRFTDGTATRAKFKVHGRVRANPLFSKPLEEGFSILLTNPFGQVYRGELQPTDLTERGAGRYIFKDKTAKDGPGVRDGLGLVRTVFRREGSEWFYHFKVKAWGDFSSAKWPVMTTQVSGVNDVAYLTATWLQTRRGWKLTAAQRELALFNCTQD